MREFADLYTYRDEKINSVGPWFWDREDDGAWTGPKEDWENCHLPTVKEHVKNFRGVVQAGGCLGMYPRLYAEMFERVYTFEPCPFNFHALVQNCQKINIVKTQAALGDRRGLCCVERGDRCNVGQQSIALAFRPEVPGAYFPMMRLDDMVFAHVDLLHLDVEDMEYQALAGSVETIKKHKPVILAEKPNGDINELLGNLGYKYQGLSAGDGIYKCP